MIILGYSARYLLFLLLQFDLVCATMCDHIKYSKSKEQRGFMLAVALNSV